MAKNKSKAEEAKKGPENEEVPEWKKQQQAQTGAKNAEEHLKPKSGGKRVKVKMLTNYRDVAKTGDVWETDAEKAAELVRLNRAEYVK